MYKDCRVRSSCQSTKMTVFFFPPYFALAKSNPRGNPFSPCHCRTPPPVIAVLEPTVIAALDAAISFYIDCRVKPDNDKGGNDRAASIASVAMQSSACTFFFSGLLRRFAPRNDR